MSFDSAFQKTVGLEGGLSLDPDDSGNWTPNGELKGTKYGISAAVYPFIDIANLTLEEAKHIYFLDYWKPLYLDLLTDGLIPEEIFDTAVNMGRFAAITILQNALNFLEPGDPVAVDGIIGPQTLKYTEVWIDKDEETLFKALNGFQFMRYVEIVKNPVKEKFAHGWMKRIQQYRG